MCVFECVTDLFFLYGALGARRGSRSRCPEAELRTPVTRGRARAAGVCAPREPRHTHARAPRGSSSGLRDRVRRVAP